MNDDDRVAAADLCRALRVGSVSDGWTGKTQAGRNMRNKGAMETQLLALQEIENQAAEYVAHYEGVKRRGGIAPVDEAKDLQRYCRAAAGKLQNLIRATAGGVAKPPTARR